MHLVALLQAGGFSPLRAALHGGFVGLATLGVLVVMSVLSWAIFLARRAALSRGRADSERALGSFLDAPDTEAFARSCKALPDSPVKRAFLEAHEHQAELAAALSRKGGALDGVRVSAGRELLTRALQGVRAREIAAARRGLVVLATIAATAPFVGLFGTVWGVVKSFASIGALKSADLAVVAPGISEALVATAAGLAAAVPAVWFYNSLTAHVRRLGQEIDRFASEFLNAYDRAIALGGDAAR
jgi:biopolymer transport protein TolQ